MLVGYDALAQEEHNPKNTVYDAKRFIGKVYTKKEMAEAQKQYAFRVSNIKIQNNWTKENVVIILKFEQCGFYHKVMHLKDEDGMARLLLIRVYTVCSDLYVEVDF